MPLPFEELPTLSLKARADTTTADDSGPTCKDGDTSSRCEKPAGASNSTLPIILGSLLVFFFFLCIPCRIGLISDRVPIFIAILVLVWLHQRHLRKLKREDAMDKTKSMDFGMGTSPVSRNSTGIPGEEKSQGQSRRQISMDISVSSPYLLPAGIHGSRESLHSMSRTGDDRYGRPMTAGSGFGQPQQQPHSPLSNNVASPWSDPNPRRDHDNSPYAHSTRHEDSPTGSQMSMTAELLRGAQQMPTSTPPRSASLLKDSPSPPRAPQITTPSPAVTRSSASKGLSVNTGHVERDSYTENDGADLRRSHMHLAKHIQVQQPAPVKAPSASPASSAPSGSPSPSALPASLQVGQPSSPPVVPQVDITLSPSPDVEPPVGTAVTTQSPRPVSDDQSDYGDGIQFRFSVASAGDGASQNAPPKGNPRKSLAPGAFDERRLSMGYRPLPPEGNPDDTPEERAMRIRSFYKEYFDDSNPGPNPPGPPFPAHQGEPAYEEDYEQGDRFDYYDDSAAVYDHETGRYQIPGGRPFAEPIVRRAMTPPPRMPPRFNPQSRSSSSSGGRFMPPGPRSYSSVSGRMGPGGRPPPPQRRPFVPPQPLHNLPTPHLLKEDAFASPIMFAPPSRLPGADSGSGRGGVRPYSPSVSPHVPLASAFADLAALPTPHMLRKSGTYTALDFAPPRKFRNDEGMGSDAGSIRSNRSGVSAMQVQNIRSGAYRVSRIPQDVVPVKEQMTNNLKPTWGMRP